MRTLRNAGAGLAAALVLVAAGGDVRAAGPEAALKTAIDRLTERLEQLERRNRELEQRLSDLTKGATPPVAVPPAAAAPALEERVKALEDIQAQTESALASERISENEPELVTRLKAVESHSLSMQKQARQIEALEGITVEASLTGMAQRVDRKGSASGRAESRLNYRGDLSVTLPGGSLGEAEGSIFAHLRFGQGNGIGLRPTYTSTPNTTAFEVGGVNDSDSSFAILAQAWYQLAVPLPLGGITAHSKQRLELTAGKIDPFVFFDQNAAADDETEHFANNAFVHNPLLDSGGDVGADAYGFSPGLRMAYMNEADKSLAWGASLGIFGSGPATNFSGSPGKPFVIGQLEASTRLFDGLPGTYRLYAWRNGRAEDFDGMEAAHSGWGVSIDQRVDDWVTLFGRFGDRTSGRSRFDRALTVGTEIGGSYWRRAADAIGFAIGWLRTSDDFRNATADGSLAGYAASGSERIAELYYRYRLNSHVEITPDLQWIQRPGGDGSAPTTTIVGLRARVGF
jgi:hypothetical protein